MTELMGDWLGKGLDVDQTYFSSQSSTNLFSWILLFNLSLGIFFAAILLPKPEPGFKTKFIWLILGFLVPPLAILFFWLKQRNGFKLTQTRSNEK